MTMRVVFFSAMLLLICRVSAAETPAMVATCNGCHQPALNVATGAPELAGQHESYLQKQLLQFQNGQRGADASDSRGQQMAAMAKALSSDDIAALARYFAQQTPQPLQTQQVDAAVLDRGRRIYIGSCGACHGDKAQGNLAFNAPALHNLNADYIALQISHFKIGARGSAKTDKPGRQMTFISRSLTSEQDIAAVAAYIGVVLP